MRAIHRQCVFVCLCSGNSCVITRGRCSTLSGVGWLAGNYGFSGMKEFTDLIREAGVCQATADGVSNNAKDAEYDQVVENLLKTKSARVVVCFCEGMTVRRLLEATRRKDAVGKFLFIGRWAVWDGAGCSGWCGVSGVGWCGGAVLQWCGVAGGAVVRCCGVAGDAVVR